MPVSTKTAVSITENPVLAMGKVLMQRALVNAKVMCPPSQNVIYSNFSRYADPKVFTFTEKC